MMISRRIHIAALLLFLVMALIQNYPLLSRITEAIPYTHMPNKGMEVVALGPSDALQIYYKFWLFKDSIVGRTRLLSDDYKFSLKPDQKHFSLQLLPLSILFFLFSFGGGAFAYNMTVLVTTTLAGYCAFTLVVYLTRSRAAGIIGGIIFMLIPYKYAQTIGGHPNGFLFFLVPLSLYFFERSYRESRIAYGFFSGLCLLSLGLMEFHIIYYGLLFYGLYIPFRFAFPLGKKTDYRHRLIRMVRTGIPLAACLALFGLNVIVRHYAMVEKSIAGGGRKYREVLLYSPVARDLTDRTNESGETYIYVGLLPPLLAIAALLMAVVPSRRKDDVPDHKELKPIMVFMGLVFLLCCLLALGPNGDRYFRLYKFLYKNLPYFNYPRVPGRIFIFSALTMSILAGYAIARAARLLKNNFSRHSTRHVVSGVLFAVVFLGIAADYRMKQGMGVMRLPQDNEAYQIVERNIGDEKLLELPIWPGDSSWSAIYLYYITLTRVHTINGYSPVVPQSYVDEVFKPLKSMNIGEMNDEQYQMLKKLGVKYVMLHEEAFPPKISRYPALFTLENLRHSPYLKFIAEDQPVYLFELLDTKREDIEPKEPSSIVGRYLEERHLTRTIGTIVDDEQAMGGKAVYADQETGPGFLAYRHRWSFPTGKYRAVFRLKYEYGKPILGERCPPPVLRVRQGDNLLSTKMIAYPDLKIPAQYEDIGLVYEVKQVGKMEPIHFEVEYFGGNGLWFDYVYVLFADQQDTDDMAFEAEKMFHIGKTVKDKEASNEEAVLVTPDDPPGNIAFGLNRRFQPGRYRATYRINAKGGFRKQPGPVCQARVIAKGDDRVLGSKTLTIRPSDDLTWKNVVIDFTIEKPEILDFPVHHYKDRTVAFDKVEIRRIENED